MTAMLLLGLPRMPDRGGAPCYDLHGSVSGEVSTEEAAHAAGGARHRTRQTGFMPPPRVRAHKSRPQALPSPACDPGEMASPATARARAAALGRHDPPPQKMCVWTKHTPHAHVRQGQRTRRAGCPGGCAVQGRSILHPLTPANPSAEKGASPIRCKKARPRILYKKKAILP